MQSPLESNDAESDTLNERNVALPEDTFNSYRGYLLNEVLHYKPIMFFVLIIVSLILSIVFFHGNFVFVGIIILLIFLTCFILIVPVCLFRMRINARDFKIKLLVEVITRKPAVKGKEWRTITYNVNRYIFDHGLWNTPYYFYRDEDCHRYFLRLIEGKTFEKQEKSSTSNVTDGQRNKGVETFTFHSKPSLQKCLSKAAEIEQQSQKDHWQEQCADIESTDTKLDTSNEPSAHLIEENVALPEEIFSSYFSYLLYEMAHCKPVMITFLLNTCLVLLFLFFHDSPSTILFYIYSLLIFVPMLGAFIKRSRAPIQNQDFEAELLVEVIKRKPAVRGKEWRTITYNMNQYLLGHGLWNTPYYFYGDEQCYVYFLSLIAGVTPKKQTTASIDDIADAQSNVPTTVTPGEDIEPASPSSAPNYRNFLLKAAEIEQQAQNNYWKERYPEMNAC
ncbi:AMH_1a_G0000750.mRNA.1.CDS.1 [Saccharomyces cerevisiae]|nr:EM14S01-3B_G0048760.mRNA.1.CDS.1 [Saccharomyces cerevisiae]CAI4240870.1 AMH_1a_G0000750.mRNA.1.CDS.1 [Saccharomyces cerevisiae]CAI6472341.1 AMH_1a_G0000750.mRNA.1.CDS.1 [Saccharomyces cerevisiae]